MIRGVFHAFARGGAVFASLLLLAACQSATPDATPTSTPSLALHESLSTLSSPLSDGAAPASPSIGSFAVYATEALEMNGNALVTGCNVGVENTTGPFLSGGAAAYFNSGAQIQPSETLYASSVYLNSGVSLGPLDTNTILGNPGATYGTLSSFPTMPAAPALPSATAGSTNVNLNSGVSQTLSPGAYGSISINSSATLSLSGGSYVFSSLTLNSGGTLTVAAASTISVTGSASFNSGSYFGPASGSGLTAKGLVLYLESSSGVNINSGAQMQALVVATNAEVTVNTSQFTGALAAAQVVMNSGAKVTCQDGFGSLVSSTNPCSGVVCSASDACHVAGVCNPSTGTCSNPTAANGTSCNDDDACTQTDQCQSGSCVGSNPVVCAAAGPCSVAGVCDASTGVCSNPPAANGTSCSDGNACTQTDQCQSGACVGTNPVVCAAAGPCSVAGVCDASTGVCSNPPAANGTSCSDGNACTQTDQCENGACVGTNPVVCAAAGPCSVAGVCDASTGVCSNPPAANGTSCSDGNACTQTDQCQSGACVGTNPVVCAAAGQCNVAGSCNPSTGACTNPAAANGVACNDGNACTQTDQCENGACVGTNPVVCTPSGQCNVAGECNPSNGTCTNPTAANGTACSDGNACSTGDTCQSGTCVGGKPVVCVASDSCHLAGTCTSGDGGSGGCSNPVAPSGTACSEGACGGTCNAAGSCQAAVVATNACFSSTCTGDGGVTPGTNTCVPTLNGTVATNLASMVGGPSINPVEVSLVRGRVLGLPTATPLAGVTVTILGHPEYSSSVTGPDGTYSIAVNGGGQVTVVYAGPPGETTYLPVQRHTPTQWLNYAVIPDVYLTPIDPHATDIALGSGSWQSASGSTITDPADEFGVDGGPPVKPTAPHTARVFFPKDTTATFAYGSCGSSQTGCGGTCTQGTCVSNVCTGTAPASLTVRLTEYTVGATGRAAMPAELPPSTAYTYAFELSADEALAAGATGVEFNQPVSFYVDDFIGFGPAQAGTVNPPVPIGFYNRATGQWVASSNGAIIEITGFAGTCPGTSCVATINEPIGDAGTVVTLSSDELGFLGQTYGSRATPLYLWRVQTPHFSGGDTNWPGGDPDGGVPPPPVPSGPNPYDPNQCGNGPSPGPDEMPGGSIIQCQNAILAQQIPVPGTPYFLRYQSERAPGRVPGLQIPLTGADWPPARLPLQVLVTISIEGQTQTLTYNPATLTPNQVASWTWDQKDAEGNTVQGRQVATVMVAYVYQVSYGTLLPDPVAPRYFGNTASPSVITASFNRALNTATLTRTDTVLIGVDDAAPLGLGGWTLSPNHVYDPAAYDFFAGDGSRRSPQTGAPILQTVPGPQSAGGIVPAVGPDGTLYEAVSTYETLGSVLVSVSPTGATQVLAGAGSTKGPYPACTPASSAQFSPEIVGLTVDPSSGNVYLAQGSMIHLYNPKAGTLETIAGTGVSGNCANNLVATQATLSGSNFGLAVAPDGSLYVTDQGCSALVRIGTDGSFATVSIPYLPGQCSTGTVGSPTWPANQNVSGACFELPGAVAVGPDGSIYVFDEGARYRVSRIDASTGIITNVIGTEPYTPGLPDGGALLSPTQYDGVAASSVQLSSLGGGLALDPFGNIYVADEQASAIYRVDVGGVAHLAAGGLAPTGGPETDGVSGAGARINHPGGIAIDPNGSVLFFDEGNDVAGPPYARIRSLSPALPSFGTGTSLVPSTDGTELYVFQQYGQHLATVDPVTGATLRTFEYDSLDRLTSVVETRGGTTTLAYSGNTVTITPPFSGGGQQTVMTLDEPGGHALSIRTPAGEVTQATYSNGLMTTLTDPRAGLHQYVYDSLGRLAQDIDPVQASTGLAISVDTSPVPAAGGIEPLTSWTTSITSALGQVTQHQDFLLSNQSRERNIIAPSGAASLSTESSSELWTTTAPDGTQSSTQLAPDPQFGMLSAYPGATTRTTPSGLTYAATRTRTASILPTSSLVTPSSITDLSYLNGQTQPWSSVFTGVVGTAPASWLFTSPAGRQRAQQLDSLGRVTSISYPGTNTLPTTSFVYDADGRVSSVTVAPNANGGGAARVTRNAYDTYLAGYLATVQDPLGNVTTYDQRDQDGRVLDIELPDFATVPASHVETTYDANGNITSVTVPPATSLPSTHTFTSTPVDLLASYTPPQVSSSTTGNDPELKTLATSYTYNLDRQITNIDTPEGTSYDVISKAYDTYGRLSATFDPLSNVTASYEYILNASNVSTDQVGNITTSDGVSLTNTFDGFLKTKTLWASSSVNGSVNWTYDSFFRPSTLQVSSAPAITFAYDLDSLYAGTSSPTFTVTRDVTGSSLDGLPYASVLGTVSDAWTYDGFGAQSSYTVKTSDGTVLYAMSGNGVDGNPITRDANGRITSMVEFINGVTHSWAMTYDARGRIESVVRDGTTTTYEYDPNGNLTGINGAPFGTYDAQDRLISFAQPGGGSWALSYTNNGDLLEKASSSQSYQFAYDLSSNLRNVQIVGSGAATVDYLIDGLNRRIGKEASTGGPYVQDGLLYDEQGRVVAELDASNNVLSTFVYGLKPNVPDYMVRGGVAYRIVSDWRGDVRLVLDTTKTGAAAVVQQVDYDEWGNVVSLVDPDCTVGGTALCYQPFGFAGGIWEPATGLVRFGARDYDPQAGRWGQKDPSRFDGGQWGIYVYAGDDPVNGSDPSGLGLPCCDSSGQGECQICWGPPPPPSPPPTCPNATPEECVTTCSGLAFIAYAACIGAGTPQPVCRGIALGIYQRCLQKCL